MPVGYGARCKICNCEYRPQAESKHEHGVSLRAISNWLKEQGVDASVESVRKHMANHFGIREETAQRYYEQSESVMQHAVEKRLTDLQMLDATVERNYRLHTLAAEKIEESLTVEVPVVTMYGKVVTDPETEKPLMEKPGPTKPIVDLLTGSASEIRQAIKLKAELLGDKDPDGNVIKVILPQGYENDDGDSN